MGKIPLFDTIALSNTGTEHAVEYIREILEGHNIIGPTIQTWCPALPTVIYVDDSCVLRDNY